MRVLVISKASKKVDEQKLPIDMQAKAKAFEAMGKFMEELNASGIMVMGTGLRPSRYGKRVLVDGARRSVTDGPFTETKEVIASFLVWEVKSIEEAVEWAKRTPDTGDGPTEIEIRPFLEMEDFDFGAPPPEQEVEGWKKMTGQQG